MKTAISFMMNVAHLSWVFANLLLIFHKLKINFKLTIDISMGKIILEVEHFIRKYDLSNVKIFQKNSSYPEMIRRTLSWFKDTNNTG